jgi:predicted histone-like DNA-binding protein
VGKQNLREESKIRSIREIRVQESGTAQRPFNIQHSTLKTLKLMLLYVLKLNQNAKMPEAYGKYYAYPVITQTVDIDGLAEHMASHNTPFSKGAIKGMITDMVSCIKELTLQGFAVKIDDLAIFSIGIRNKEGAASEKEFTIAKNIDGFRLRARGTGEFSAKTINLEATLKKASALLGDGTTPDTTPDTGKDTGKDTPGGDNTDQGGSGTTGEGGGDGLE